MQTQIDLSRVIKAKAPARKRTVTLRTIVPTLALRKDLAVIYLRVVKAWRNHIAETILPMYGATLERVVKDDVTSTLAHALSRAEEDAYRVVAEQKANAQAWTVRVEKWHLGQWVSALKSGAGVSIAGVLLNEDAADQISFALERNASLITNLSADMQKRVEQTIWQGVANQVPRRELAKQLQESLDIGRSRALTIARDQTNKLSGELDRLRQEQAGITSYEWVDSGKVHYRPEHRSRRGKIYRWDKPPADGHPRTQPNCGCSAKAVLEI